MKQLSIIRLLDEETFFVDAGINDGIKQQQFIEVLNPKRSYKNLAQVIDVFDQYTLCKKLGKKKIFFGDTVRLRPINNNSEAPVDESL
ncbi:hypothetical protein NQ035_08645 [Staphylococcus gallinarum]|uniref:Uncharacterized protein n=1 Tax=Staphylococcus gallinarum TaxID=1293 RepID=A0A0D0SIY1_STAGA|nr:hypothetical protein [Staphylococcus gallinarum]KIR12400.1 hypothetical protein SH09_02790 [Staphylococcus gallinarum]MCD8787341.1 hypothetical protein [Staphylococcus gallinarum]MCD8821723.1 hypothetical protein [Staphylococcus gallinarum]MCD8827317.1 hypothetical protein [Staphylococcus gallinarum]MCD8859607.1 hypothetical protein [Staphylococcus gallinarum]